MSSFGDEILRSMAPGTVLHVSAQFSRFDRANDSHDLLLVLKPSILKVVIPYSAHPPLLPQPWSSAHTSEIPPRKEPIGLSSRPFMHAIGHGRPAPAAKDDAVPRHPLAWCSSPNGSSFGAKETLVMDTTCITPSRRSCIPSYVISARRKSREIYRIPAKRGSTGWPSTPQEALEIANRRSRSPKGLSEIPQALQK